MADAEVLVRDQISQTASCNSWASRENRVTERQKHSDECLGGAGLEHGVASKERRGHNPASGRRGSTGAGQAKKWRME
jgi:hypothetical protein